MSECNQSICYSTALLRNGTVPSLCFALKMNGLVHYALVAFWEKSGCRIVADYPEDQNMGYRSIALNTVNDLKMIEDNKISIDRGKYTVHVLVAELHYACLTLKSDCPLSAARLESCSQVLLERLRCVYKELPMLADLSTDLTNLVVNDLSKPLKKIIEEYNNQNVDPKNLIPKLEEELAEIRHALMDGVQKLIDRGQKLDELIRKTQSLQFTLQKDFHVMSRRSRKKKNVLIAAGVAALMITSTSLLMILMYIGIL